MTTSHTASGRLSLFHKALSAELERADTDPEAAAVEAAHSSGLHGYVSSLDTSIAKQRAQIARLTADAAAGAPSVDGDPISHQTAFEAAAPVLRANAKARARRSIAIVMTEVGLVGLAMWAIWVLTEHRYPEDEQRPRSGYFPRLALFIAIGLMIISAASGVVYLA
jgi:hypothetical protein